MVSWSRATCISYVSSISLTSVVFLWSPWTLSCNMFSVPLAYLSRTAGEVNCPRPLAILSQTAGVFNFRQATTDLAYFVCVVCWHCRFGGVLQSFIPDHLSVLSIFLYQQSLLTSPGFWLLSQGVVSVSFGSFSFVVLVQGTSIFSPPNYWCPF